MFITMNYRYDINRLMEQHGLNACPFIDVIMVIPLPCNSVTTVTAELEKIFQKNVAKSLVSHMKSEN